MGNPNAQFSGKSFELKKFDFYFHCIKKLLGEQRSTTTLHYAK